jgi:hypothetical protein
MSAWTSKDFRHRWFSPDGDDSDIAYALEADGIVTDFVADVRALLARVRELEAQFAGATDGECARAVERDKARARVGGLEEAIRIYGGHCGGCEAKSAGRCSCGFRAVWDSVQPRGDGK